MVLNIYLKKFFHFGKYESICLNHAIKVSIRIILNSSHKDIYQTWWIVIIVFPIRHFLHSLANHHQFNQSIMTFGITPSDEIRFIALQPPFSGIAFVLVKHTELCYIIRAYTYCTRSKKAVSYIYTLPTHPYILIVLSKNIYICTYHPHVFISNLKNVITPPYRSTAIWKVWIDRHMSWFWYRR